jgi:ATP-dependent RNA helicase DeaD
MSFEKLGIEPRILDILKKAGFERPMPIQSKCIPIIRQGKDVIAQSETGSGKTLAFAIPIMEKVEQGRGVQALVITPTRELANQITKEFLKLTAYKMAHITNVYGGVSIEPQIDSLRSADIVVGTPGRILDHLERRTINLSGVKYLVLDEADRMLDMGFIDDVERIIRFTPKSRQTMLFSATIPGPVHRISQRYMRDPVSIETEKNVKPELLHQVYYDVRENEKFSMLVHLLEKEKPKLALVFCGRRSTADAVARNLQINGVNAKVIHGGLEQGKRERVISDTHSGNVHVLVATDVASRGLDIKGITHVFNFDIPDKRDDYVHRIGRTARAGKSGLAVAIISDPDYDNFRRILRDNPEFKVVDGGKPEFRRIPFNPHAGREHRGTSQYGQRQHSRSGAYGRGGHDERSSRGGHGGYAGRGRHSEGHRRSERPSGRRY